MHLNAFRFRIEELHRTLSSIAVEHEAETRLARDSERTDPDDEPYTIVGFITRILDLARDVLARHEKLAAEDYADEATYRKLVQASKLCCDLVPGAWRVVQQCLCTTYWMLVCFPKKLRRGQAGKGQRSLC